MIRWLLASLIALLLGSVIAVAALTDNGYIMIGYDVWTIEGSLALFILLDILLFAALYIAIRSFIRVWNVPANVQTWHHQRQIRLAQKALTRGLLEMAEGDWKSAEKRLIRHASNAETPLLNYLAAARAAQLQGEHARRDQYLHLAHQSMPSADVAVSLTQAELQLAHQQLEQALATLEHLKSIAPKHVYVLKLLSELYQQLGDWQQLKELLPELKRRKACNANELDHIENRVHLYSLQKASSKDLKALELTWKQIPKHKKQENSLLLDYSRHLVSLDATDKAIKLIADHLNKRLDENWKENGEEEILTTFGNITGTNPSQQLTLAENWLKHKENNQILLLILGRLSLKAKLWGKARSYLEQSIKIQPLAETYQELGHLLERLGETQEAQNCFRQGLSVGVKADPIEIQENLLPSQNAQEEKDALPMPTDQAPPLAKLKTAQ